MADVNINNAPYNDRFNEDEHYDRVLYQPNRPVQSSELIEADSIQQHYMGELGGALFSDGNIQEGMEYRIEGDEIIVGDGKVYLGGKIRTFHEQAIPFETEGTFNVGIRLDEEIVTAEEDEDLLDHSIGVPSFLSKGADRLKQTVVLVGNDEEAANIYRFEDGNLFVQSQKPEMSKLNDVLAERTFDESGSYKVNGLEVYTEPIEGDDEHLNIVVDVGRAYVLGYQIDKPSATRVKVEKALGTREITSEAFYYDNKTRRGRLGNSPVEDVSRVIGQVQVNSQVVSRGTLPNGQDRLPHGSVIEVKRVWTDEVEYTQGVDYQLSNGNSIDWSPSGNEPNAGTSYRVTYVYNKNMVEDQDYKVVQEGSIDSLQTYIDFNGMTGNVPVVGSMVQVDYTYYLAREDLVILDKDGNVIIKEGQYDSLNVLEPPFHDDPYTLVLGSVKLFPNSNTSRTVPSAVNRLSMTELQKLKTRLENLEYNQAVNALDQPAMAGVNPVNLRGVFSDGFISLDKSDTSHPDHTVAFSFEDAEITLPYSEINLRKPNLLSVGSDAYVWGRLVTAPFTESIGVSQMQATEAYNVNPYNVYNNRAKLTLTPSEDNWIDEDRVIVMEEDTDYVRLRRWWAHPGQYLDHKVFGNTIRLDEGQEWEGKSWRYDVDHGRTGTTLSAGGTQTFESAIEFMRQIPVDIRAENLLPMSNNLMLTFDGIRVPLTPKPGFNRGSEPGTLQANAQGIVEGTFEIPSGVRTGIREVILSNADNAGTARFVAQGTKKTVEDTIIRTHWTIDLHDPLAQTFQFPQNQTISSIGLYFASKDNSSNVSVQVRGVTDSGFPSKEVFGEAILTPSQVRTSADGTAETKVTFDDPIVATAGREYSIVVRTNSDQYTMWVGTRGQQDVRSGSMVNRNPYNEGVLFSSSNASAWTAHQNSDMKFVVYTANFNEEAVLEFETIEDISADELVLMASYLTPDNTSAVWDARVIFDSEPQDTNIESKPWLPIANYVGVEVGQVARQVKLRAKFKANRHMSPLLSLQDITLTTFLTALQGSYVSRTIDLSDGTLEGDSSAAYNTIRVQYEAFEPGGTQVIPRYSVDGGTTWENFSVDATTYDVGDGFVNFMFDEKIRDGNATEDSLKIRLDLSSQNSYTRPRARRLMVNARNE